MEHVVFFPAPDGTPGFRRTPDRADALRLVEHLRNVEGIEQVSVHELTEVPLSFRAYYHVQVPAEVVPIPVTAPEPVQASPAAAPVVAVVPTVADPAPVWRATPAPVVLAPAATPQQDEPLAVPPAAPSLALVADPAAVAPELRWTPTPLPASEPADAAVVDEPAVAADSVDEVPAVEVPAVEVPAVEVPAVEVPAADVPAVEAAPGEESPVDEVPVDQTGEQPSEAVDEPEAASGEPAAGDAPLLPSQVPTAAIPQQLVDAEPIFSAPRHREAPSSLGFFA